ncbi:uncharacterized protein [Physcomitrium patens]|uniref:uncharacterized protein n=1 Tax=Physcomitrium patens TaxID=3218 RepID=UPI003CCC94B8
MAAPCQFRGYCGASMTKGMLASCHLFLRGSTNRCLALGFSVALRYVAAADASLSHRVSIPASELARSGRGGRGGRRERWEEGEVGGGRGGRRANWRRRRGLFPARTIPSSGTLPPKPRSRTRMI